MTPFQTAVAAADLDIFGGLGDPAAILTPQDGSDPVTGPAIHRNPREAEQLRDGAITVARPEVHAPVSVFPRVRKGDVWTLETRAGVGDWKVVAAPTRPGGGHRWICEVEQA